MDASAAPTRQLVRMRGRSYVALVFCPAVPIVGWLEEIDATLARSPGFFVGKPVVLDLSAVDLSQSGIAHLVTSLEQRNSVLGSRVWMPLTSRRHAAFADRRTPLCACRMNRKSRAKPKPTSLLLESPVRSGQSVFTEGE